MSAIKSSTKFNNTKSKNIIKPYCAVCHAAGKPEVVYTSHFVREKPDPMSKVICPTLLSQSCLHCGKQGHTTSYCSLKKKQEREVKKENYKQAIKAKEQQEPSIVKKKPTNVFDLLKNSDSESESEHEVITKKDVKTTEKKALPKMLPSILKKDTKKEVNTEIHMEEFPALSTFPIKRKRNESQEPQISFAKVAAKSAEEYETEMYEKKLMELSKKRITPQIVVKPMFKASDPECDWCAIDSDMESELDENITEEVDDDEYDW
jgi:hypothetical protein